VRLGKASRLLRRREFLAVQGRGRKLWSSVYAVLALPNGGEAPRLGVTVSSKVANAVNRNRVKRWVRQAFREVGDDLPGVDLVVIARPGAAGEGLAAARRALAETARVLSSSTSAPAGRAP
jgi:ribonuclease P protein component